MATKVFNNNGPIYLTAEKYEEKRQANQLVPGQEYRIIGWEAQEKLVSAVNIKSINGASILGEGNMVLPPACPTTTDGTFVLKCTVSNGKATYSWVAQ